MKKRVSWTYAWWAGFLVLTFSLGMLSICTFIDVKNPSLIEVWKYTLTSSIGYIIGLPIGAAFSEKNSNRS